MIQEEVARHQIKRLTEALERICSVQLGPEEVTDPDWKARLMQGIAREAIRLHGNR